MLAANRVKEPFFLLAEAPQQGNLRQFNEKNHGCIPMPSIFKIALDVLKALHYLHTTIRIGHYNLTMENIWVFGSSEFQAKLLCTASSPNCIIHNL